MSWIKPLLQISVPIIATVIALDSIAYLGFREKIENFIPGYGVNVSNFDRGYPRYHFKSDDELGFDITPDFKTTTSTKPEEYHPYEVWGNSFGCFDDEWESEDQKGGIYLAGDSFTWGYVAYDKKFGTLLQQLMSKPVYQCGVTHTGQRHQFKKFKRLFESGIKPSLVVVNVVWNDVNNDFFFPHSTVVEGYMVETVEQCGYHESGNYSVRQISRQDAENVVKATLEAPTTLKSALKHYSLTANIVAAVLRSARDTASDMSSSEIACRMWLYGGAYETLGSDYAQSELSASNRQVITDWIQHSSENNYKIVFSLIPAKSAKTENYPFIKKFIESKGGMVISFEEQILNKDLEREALYYEVDEHFNETGNEEYAKFLKSWASELVE